MTVAAWTKYVKKVYHRVLAEPDGGDETFKEITDWYLKTVASVLENKKDRNKHGATMKTVLDPLLKLVRCSFYAYTLCILILQ